ncbi:hypothetical protein TNCV_4776451 [Trichonephila clavipes]|nr:hypothetical protein TNCV_4776451 [Trichonephila clavipes]
MCSRAMEEPAAVCVVIARRGIRTSYEHHGGYASDLQIGRRKCTINKEKKCIAKVYLHCLGLAADEACQFLSHARTDGDYLLQCTGLDEYPTDDIVSWYCKSRCQMVKRSCKGVG